MVKRGGDDKNSVVKIDALVFLRIAKHGKQMYPNSASGSLLGLDADDALRVTNCFAYKSREGDVVGTKAGEEFLEYQYGMLKAIEEARGDANAVGWYETTHHGNFLSEALIEYQYQFQKEVPSAVVVVYEQSKQKQGKCGFAAYRLTEKAMKQRSMTGSNLAGAVEGEEEDLFQDFPSSELLEEVPIMVHCSPLAETLLLQYTGVATSAFDSGFSAAFDTSQTFSSMERNLSLLLESLEELSLQQREMNQFERMTRVQKEKHLKNQQHRMPKTLDTLNLTQQIRTHCSSVDTQAQDTFSKLFLLSADKEEDTPNDFGPALSVRNVMEKLRTVKN
ncbi:unnamed protein product [Amoebophrya sp. A25]|nr:unnamed protein product [Amoebophrya sp. A25]|eukprot:GSA25T00021222001.1